MRRPAVSKHLRPLRRAGLLTGRRAAQTRFDALDSPPLPDVERWLDSYRIYRGGRHQDRKRIYAALPDPAELTR